MDVLRHQPTQSALAHHAESLTARLKNITIDNVNAYIKIYNLATSSAAACHLAGVADRRPPSEGKGHTFESCRRAP